jgi:hypothetical protein
MDSEDRRDKQRRLEEILERVNQLPVIDSRTPDEVIGYDDYGLPKAEPDICKVQRPDFEAQAKKILGDRVLYSEQDFLTYRHREWELGIAKDPLPPRQPKVQKMDDSNKKFSIRQRIEPEQLR